MATALNLFSWCAKPKLPKHFELLVFNRWVMEQRLYLTANLRAREQITPGKLNYTRERT